MRSSLFRTAIAAAPLLLALVPSGPVHGHGAAHATATRAGASAAEQHPWGIAGDAATVTRTITLRMNDAMRFVPDHLRVREGETLRLVVHNDGAMLHELVIGTPDALAEHAELMLKFPDMEHDEPYMAHVDPGRHGEITWQFNRPGHFEFACLIPGHYQAGMRGTIVVTASPSR